MGLLNLARTKYGIREIKKKQLKEYNICGIPTSPAHLVLISEMLKTNTSLQKLEFETEEVYQIGDAYKDLGDALRVNTTLTELRIVHHPRATTEQEQMLIDSIAVNKGLRLVLIDDMSEEGHEAMAKVMPNASERYGRISYTRDIDHTQSVAGRETAGPSGQSKRSAGGEGGGDQGEGGGGDRAGKRAAVGNDGTGNVVGGK